MSSPEKFNLTNTLPLLNPPICLEVLYTHIRNGTSPNEYIVNFKTKGQSYTPGIYNCNDIKAGMYTSNSFNGYIFLIKEVIEDTNDKCEVVLVDIDELNSKHPFY